MIFLKVSLMAIFLTATTAYTENRSPKVVVVGAGLAGLTTAYRLHQKGMDVHVYEARNRVGGRVLTVQIGSTFVELGGQNITDGGGAENIHRLIEEFGLELTRNRVPFNRSYFTGEKLIPVQQLLSNKHFHPEDLKAQLDALVQSSRSMREVLNGLLEEEDPLYKTLTTGLAAYEGATIEKLSPLYAETLYYMLLGGIAAAHQGNGEEENPIHLLSIKGGNTLLPEKMAEALGDRVHLNRPLKEVSKDSEGSFVLTFQDDQQVKADRLVLAIPCSVYDEILFGEKVLPLERLEAIKSIPYGANAKLMVPFSQSPSRRVSLVNDRIVSFFDSDRSVLILYYTGEASRFSMDTILDTYRRERPMIEMGFEALCPPLVAPVYAKDQAFALYEGPVGYSWPNDPYAKGSYAYIAPGQEALLTALKEDRGEIVKRLFAPIDQKLYFVGEHASILMEVPGTMEAACESGERAARMILK
jgi:monoamine oxidase